MSTRRNSDTVCEESNDLAYRVSEQGYANTLFKQAWVRVVNALESQQPLEDFIFEVNWCPSELSPQECTDPKLLVETESNCERVTIRNQFGWHFYRMRSDVPRLFTIEWKQLRSIQNPKRFTDKFFSFQFHFTYPATNGQVHTTMLTASVCLSKKKVELTRSDFSRPEETSAAGETNSEH